MAKNIRQVLSAILAAIDGIETTIGEKTLDQFSADWAVKHAVQRGIEIISEASRRLPKALQDLQPSIEWKEIHGIGNVLRHDYDSIVDGAIYGIVREKLPALRLAILAIEATLDEREK